MMRILYSLLVVLFVSTSMMCEKSVEPLAITTNISDIFTDGSYGCKNFIVYKSNPGFSKFILVEFDLSSLDVDSNEINLDISTNKESVNVLYHYYSINKDSIVFTNFPYCNDVLNPSYQPVEWAAQEGIIRIIKTDLNQGLLKVTVQLNNVSLYNEKGGERLYINELVFSEVVVGWLPG